MYYVAALCINVTQKDDITGKNIVLKSLNILFFFKCDVKSFIIEIEPKMLSVGYWPTDTVNYRNKRCLKIVEIGVFLF